MALVCELWPYLSPNLPVLSLLGPLAGQTCSYSRSSAGISRFEGVQDPDTSSSTLPVQHDCAILLHPHM